MGFRSPLSSSNTLYKNECQASNLGMIITEITSKININQD